MILNFEDIGVSINLANMCFMEKKEQPNEQGELTPLIIFVFSGGMGRPIAFPNTKIRDEHFAGIQKALAGHSQPLVAPVQGIPRHLLGVERR